MRLAVWTISMAQAAGSTLSGSPRRISATSRARMGRSRLAGAKRLLRRAASTRGACPATTRVSSVASTCSRRCWSVASRVLQSEAVTRIAACGPQRAVERLQHLLGVAVHPHPREDLAHDALGVDHEGGADHADDLLAVQHLLAPGPVLLGHGLVGVGEEGEVQLVLGLELLVGRERVAAHAEHDRALLLEGGLAVAERAGLAGAAGGVVLRVEVEHDGLAPQLLQAHVGRPRSRAA